MGDSKDRPPPEIGLLSIHRRALKCSGSPTLVSQFDFPASVVDQSHESE
jgi:hypothetical protein